MLTRIQAQIVQIRYFRPARTFEALAHERFRFTVLAAIACLKLLNLFGGVWDIQWHVAIGRDSLWIAPHLMVMAAFVSGSSLAIGMLVYETRLARSGLPVLGTVRLGLFHAPLAFWGILLGYSGALLSGGFDELWHRIFGIDATLWSPPHLAIMFFTMVVDISLLIGVADSARRLGWGLGWRQPFFWFLTLAGAYTFEAVNFQMSQAVLNDFKIRGSGLLGLTFPVLVGAIYPMSMLLAIKLARRLWIVAPVFITALGLQYAGVAIASAGFALLKPVPQIDVYVLLNPDSTAAMARLFASQTGFDGLIGYEQAWLMMLSGIPLGLVALLELAPWVRRRPLAAAPVYSASLIVVTFLWFLSVPALRTYFIHWENVLLGALVATGGGLLFGWIGLRLAALAGKS